MFLAYCDIFIVFEVFLVQGCLKYFTHNNIIDNPVLVLDKVVFVIYVAKYKLCTRHSLYII